MWNQYWGPDLPLAVVPQLKIPNFCYGLCVEKPLGGSAALLVVIVAVVLDRSVAVVSLETLLVVLRLVLVMMVMMPLVAALCVPTKLLAALHFQASWRTTLNQ